MIHGSSLKVVLRYGSQFFMMARNLQSIFNRILIACSTNRQSLIFGPLSSLLCREDPGNEVVGYQLNVRYNWTIPIKS